MSNLLDEMLAEFPENYETHADSNNYKMLKLVAKGSEDNRGLYDTIQRFWDVDQASGVGLDRLGKEEGLSRGGYDEETYRRLIKVQYVVNMSDGSIEDINTILRAYMGKDFLYQQEGWDSDFEEPAAIMVNIRNSTQSFPVELMNTIKPNAVAFYIVANQLFEWFKLYARSYTVEVKYPTTGRFRTAPMSGAKADWPYLVRTRSYPLEITYKRCGNFRAGQEVNR